MLRVVVEHCALADVEDPAVHLQLSRVHPARYEGVFAQMRLELGVLASRQNALSDEQRDALRALAGKDPVWAARIGEL